MRASLSYPQAATLLFLAQHCPTAFVSCGKMAAVIHQQGAVSTPYGRARVLRTLYDLEERGLLERGPNERWVGGRLTTLGHTRALVESLMPLSARVAKSHGVRQLPHAAIAEGRTRNPKTIVRDFSQTRVLKEGRNNDKVGFMVTKGHLRGYAIYSLSLEERATCPRYCGRWNDCYGNNMAFAQRMAHGPELEDKIAEEVAALVANIRRNAGKGSTHKPRGLLIRLHVLGDFYSREYVAFWWNLLRQYPEVSIFGYTAYHPASTIGLAVHGMKQRFSDLFGLTRCNIRFSGGPADKPGNAVWYGPGTDHPTPPNGSFACPEQLDKATSCATCAACWQGTRTVAFRIH